jgi:hypothetical protein
MSGAPRFSKIDVKINVPPRPDKSPGAKAL